MEHKERILRKAYEMFTQFGIRSVSMDDMATNLGMSKKTLYQHFADKDELVSGVVSMHINEMENDCTCFRKDAKDAIHEMVLMMERVLEQFRNMNPMLLYDLEKFHFKAYQLFRNHKDNYLLNVIQDNIAWGMQDGLYREDINVELIAKYRIESMMIPFNVNIFPAGKFPLSVTSHAIMENFIYGLTTLKGHKLFQKYNNQLNKKSTL